MQFECAGAVCALTCNTGPVKNAASVRVEPTQYSGYAAHAEAAPEPIPGKITVGLDWLTFEAEGIRVSIRLEHLEISRGPKDEIVFTAKSAPEWLIGTEDGQILKDFFILRRHNLCMQARQLQQLREGRRMLKLAGAFLGAFGLIALAAWALSSVVIWVVVNQVPVAWEKDLGDAVYAKLSPHLLTVNEPALQAYVRPVLDRLVAGLPNTNYTFQIEFVASPLPNASALPGGRILIFDGLFEVAQTPEELAAVLAHEMAHVIRRHGLRTLIGAAGPYYVLQLFIRDRHGFLGRLIAGSELLVMLQYSRKLETEADEVAWRLLEAANIDPRGLASFLRKEEAFEAQVQARLGTLADGTSKSSKPPELLRTHPETERRLQRLDRLWARAKRKTGFVNLGAEITNQYRTQAIYEK